VVDRPKLLDVVVEALTKGAAPVVALAGPPGFGKTTLALQACRAGSVAAHWPGGALCLVLGDEPDLSATLARAYTDLTGRAPGAVSAEDFAQRIGDELAERGAFLVIDDAWSRAGLDVLLTRAGAVPRLVTTRNRALIADWADTTVLVDEPLLPGEAIAVLAGGPVIATAELDSLTRLGERVGRWPLLLALASGYLRRLVSGGLPLLDATERLEHRYAELGVVAFDARRPEERYQAVTLTMTASLGQLPKLDRHRYMLLAVFSSADATPLRVVADFWDLTIPQAEGLVLDLADQSLLRYDVSEQTIQLHRKSATSFAPSNRT
jgi:hypothetical protein